MKAWNKPELATLDLNATKGGLPIADGEGLLISIIPPAIIPVSDGTDHHHNSSSGKNCGETSNDNEVTNYTSGPVSGCGKRF